MLPLHGQSTAAVKILHWAGPTPYVLLSGSHVFVKQAKHLFAEFLSFTLDLISRFLIMDIFTSLL